ncbi:diaminopropionate ammonia-lyase [Sneathiella litorea]|uniref:Diaminopropionate ammonia-lyase n=1 Tax=Sneathiella litorea TaxID=2606216 RepID=A0A6L8W8W2_9PROT|nr:diaminopropionate ammonia-lyase [Sneathiella litorea]MZR30667.1 diaminopropionate ammonia-lyase [Sneathiella litorea]
MRVISNPHRGKGLPDQEGLECGSIITNPQSAMALIAQCPVAHTTPLLSKPEIAHQLGISQLYIKDERSRMGLGSFKALGAAFAIAKQATARWEKCPEIPIESVLKETTFVCASAGNHGLSMAAGARVFGSTAVVYLSESVPDSFADKLKSKGAVVKRAGANYEASMAAARKAAHDNGWQLLSDSSWLGYSSPARDVMEGYLIMGAELSGQIKEAPSHIFLQAGVGGLAAAAAAMSRRLWQHAPKIIIVEPESAPCLIDSIEAAKPIHAKGEVSNMGRLDCKEPSHLALRYLAEEADYFMTISDEFADKTCRWLAQHNLDSTPSGIAGLAGLKMLREANDLTSLDEEASVLTFLSEEATDNA